MVNYAQLFVYTTTRKGFVIFTCRYFKLSWNTTAPSQANCRNFPCSSIIPWILCKFHWRQFHGVCVTRGCLTVSTFYAKTSKMNCAFTSLGALLFNCPSWIFYMLYYNSRVLLRYYNSSKIPCTKPWFFPSKFRKISLFMKVLKIGIFGRFLTK